MNLFHMLKNKSNNNIKTILLCGGKGERLYPLTSDIPKPLVKIKDKSILSHIIDHLFKFDMNDLIILTGYKSEKIKSYVEEKYVNSNIQIIDSGDVDIIQRIKDALPYIDNDFMLLYGDTISNINITNLKNFHSTSDYPVTMTVWPLVSQFGIVDIDNKGGVLGFKEKPKLDKWINIGYFYFDNQMKDMIKNSLSFSQFLEKIAGKKMLGAYKHEGIHITVNTVKELSEAKKNISNI
jgi:glucose-1-phosphate cytidylyltransferase